MAAAYLVDATAQEVVGQQPASTTLIEMVNAQRPRDRQRQISDHASAHAQISPAHGNTCPMFSDDVEAAIATNAECIGDLDRQHHASIIRIARNRSGSCVRIAG